MSVANEEGVAASRTAAASTGPDAADAQMRVIRNGATRAAPISHARGAEPGELDPLRAKDARERHAMVARGLSGTHRDSSSADCGRGELLFALGQREERVLQRALLRDELVQGDRVSRGEVSDGLRGDAGEHHGAVGRRAVHAASVRGDDGGQVGAAR